MMSKEAIEAAREYKREWRRKNPEKVKAATERYWEKRARLKKEKQNHVLVEGKRDCEQDS